MEEGGGSSQGKIRAETGVMKKNQQFVESVSQFISIMQTTWDGYSWVILEIQMFGRSFQFTSTTEDKAWANAAQFLKELVLQKFGEDAQ